MKNVVDPEVNKFVMFKNYEKKKKIKHPDYVGIININGEIKELAMWTLKSRNGHIFYSGELQDVGLSSEPAIEEPKEYKQPKKKTDGKSPF